MGESYGLDPGPETGNSSGVSPQDPKPGRRGRLSQSGRFLPLVKPATIAPPLVSEFDEDDDYAEVSIERGVIEVEIEPPAAGDEADAGDDEGDEELTPPR
jgi:hypothetical protein